MKKRKYKCLLWKLSLVCWGAGRPVLVERTPDRVTAVKPARLISGDLRLQVRHQEVHRGLGAVICALHPHLRGALAGLFGIAFGKISSNESRSAGVDQKTRMFPRHLSCVRIEGSFGTSVLCTAQSHFLKGNTFLVVRKTNIFLYFKEWPNDTLLHLSKGDLLVDKHGLDVGATLGNVARSSC